MQFIRRNVCIKPKPMPNPQNQAKRLKNGMLTTTFLLDNI